MTPAEKLEKAREALEIAAKFCGKHTADACPDTVAIPINEALKLLSTPSDPLPSDRDDDGDDEEVIRLELMAHGVPAALIASHREAAVKAERERCAERLCAFACEQNAPECKCRCGEWKAIMQGDGKMSERTCETCGGKGYTAEHSPGVNDHDGEGNCLGACPVQVQCEKCNGTGKIQPPTEPTEIDRLYEDELGYQAARASEFEAEVRRLRAEIELAYKCMTQLTNDTKSIRTELAEEKAHGDRLDKAIEECLGFITELKNHGVDGWVSEREVRAIHAAHEARRKG